LCHPKLRYAEVHRRNSQLNDPCLKIVLGRNDRVFLWMRSSRVVRASDCRCKSRHSTGCNNPSIFRHSGI
jgi:hypothetical protein